MSWWRRYASTVVLAGLAAICAVLGILAVTVWRPAQELSASFEPDEPYVMIREGVLPLYANTVTVTARTADPDEKVWVAFGDGTDVSSWLYGHSFDIVAGTLSATELAVERVSAPEAPVPEEEPVDGEEEPAAEEQAPPDETAEGEEAEEPQSGEIDSQADNPLYSDMWSRTIDGTATITLAISADELDSVVLLAADGKEPLALVTLTWPTPTTNGLALVFWPLTGALVLLALALGAVTAFGGKRQRTQRQKMDRRAREAVAETGVIAAVSGTEGAEETEEPSSDTQEVVIEDSEILEVADDVADAADAAGAADAEEADEAQASDTVAIPTDKSRVTATTESGMMNLGAMQFPTRRALREAGERGIETIVVGSREFVTTGTIPVVGSATPPKLPANIKWRSKRGAETYGTSKENQ